MDPKIVLGHVAATPWPSAAAAAAIIRERAAPESAAKAGAAAIKGAEPLSGNAYKLQLVKTAVKRAVIAALSA